MSNAVHSGGAALGPLILVPYLPSESSVPEHVVSREALTARFPPPGVRISLTFVTVKGRILADDSETFTRLSVSWANLGRKFDESLTKV